MRWLIFILLLSCGKHQSPKALDLRDSDGDQILNAEESEVDKYIANIQDLGKVQGRIRFKLNEWHEFPFANQPVNAGDMMVRSEKYLLSNNYLSEGRKIKINANQKVGNALSLNQYSVLIEFDDPKNKPEELLLIQDKMTISLGKWEQSMEMKLTVHQLQALLKGTAYFSLGKKFKHANAFEVSSEETIKEKTYRVYFYDGSKSEVLYISKDLDFHDFLKHLKIKKIQEVVEDQFFFNPADVSTKGWYFRSFPTGDKVISYSTIQDMKQAFLTHYTFNKTDVLRENGSAKKELKLTKLEDAAVYLRIRPTQILRTFLESMKTEPRRTGGGGGREGNGGDQYTCDLRYRKIQQETLSQPIFGDLLQNIQITSDGIDISETFMANTLFEESLDENGLFWEIKVNLPFKSLTIGFKNLPASTFVKAGLISTACNGGQTPAIRYSGVDTNSEGKFSLAIESYIEKIE